MSRRSRAGRPSRVILGALGLLVVAGSSLSCSGTEPPAPPRTGPPDLVVDASDAPPASPPVQALRSRMVDLDTAALYDGATARDATVRLDLFDDADYTTALTHADTAGVEQWTGTLEGVELSTVVLVRAGDAFRLTVNSPAHVFAVAPAGAHYLLTELDSGGEPPDPELTAPPS